MLYERYQNFENRTYQDPTCFTSFSFIESRTLCLLAISTDGAFGQIPSHRTGYYAKRSGASSMLIKKLIFFRAFQTKYLLYLRYLCLTKRVVFHTHITCNSSKTVSQNIGLQCCKSINIQNRTFELRVKTFNPFLRAHIASKTNQTSVWNLEWGKEQNCFFSSLGQNQMQLISSCRIFLVTKVTTDFFIKEMTFSTSNWLWRKKNWQLKLVSSPKRAKPKERCWSIST